MCSKCTKSCFNSQDKSLEAEASDALGGVYQLMADNETALQVCVWIFTHQFKV